MARPAYLITTDLAPYDLAQMASLIDNPKRARQLASHRGHARGTPPGQWTEHGRKVDARRLSPQHPVDRVPEDRDVAIGKEDRTGRGEIHVLPDEEDAGHRDRREP